MRRRRSPFGFDPLPRREPAYNLSTLLATG
jgi:hypothetical protein